VPSLIRNPAEACEELDVAGLDAAAVHSAFGSSFRIADTAGVRRLGQSVLVGS
jgi:hypothetical protein